MNTLGWLLILTASLLVHSVVKGRNITSIPTDLTDLFTAATTGDQKAMAEIFSRTGDTNNPSPVGDVAAPIGTEATSTVTGGNLLEEIRRLSSGAKYVWGGTGPTGYDCSGLVWRGMLNLHQYNGPRFTTLTFSTMARSAITNVSGGTVGDVVVWTDHMGVVDGRNSMFSALSPTAGIGSSSISGHGGSPSYYRVTATPKATRDPGTKRAG